MNFLNVCLYLPSREKPLICLLQLSPLHKPSSIPTVLTDNKNNISDILPGILKVLHKKFGTTL